MSKLIGYTPYAVNVAEMSADGVSDLVKLEDGLAEKVVDPSDTDPMFVTIEVLNEGVSRNNRRYTKELIASVAEQINRKRVDGYRGHLTEEERSHKAPDAETIWLGATVKEVGGKVRLFAKGYVLPYAANLRSYLRSAKAAGKNVAVSIYGKAIGAKDAAGVMTMSQFNLESVDWARPGSEGVQNMGMFSVTAEMSDDSNNPLKGDDVNREEAIKSAKVSELRELNPEVVQEIAQEATTAKEAELSTVVSEMTSLKEIAGENPAETIAEMQTKIRTHELDDNLRTKVQSTEARKFVRRMAVAEMESHPEKAVGEIVDESLGTEEAKRVIREQVEAAPEVRPGIERTTGEARRFTKIINKRS